MEELVLSLSDKQKAIFGALLCERLRPQYQAFCAATQWGSPAVYQEGVILLYTCGAGSFDIPTAQDLLAQLTAVTPFLHEFDHAATPFAVDACVALEQGLLFLTDKDERHLVAAATAATESVELFIQAYSGLPPNGRAWERTLAANPFMLAEQTRQLRVLHALLSLNEFDSATIQQLRQLNGAGGIIDLALLQSEA